MYAHAIMEVLLMSHSAEQHHHYICILILAGPPYKQDHQEKGNAPKARATELPEEQPAANVVVFNGPSSSASRTPQHRTSTVTYSVLYLGIVLIARGLVT